MIKTFIYKHSGVLALFWFLVILLLCATPGEYIPTNDWLEILKFDKLVHAGMFFILTGLLFVTAEKRKSLSSITISLIFLLCIFYGISLELLQGSYFRNRGADWLDVIANFTGSLLALIYLRKLIRFLSTEKFT